VSLDNLKPNDNYKIINTQQKLGQFDDKGQFKYQIEDTKMEENAPKRTIDLKDLNAGTFLASIANKN